MFCEPSGTSLPCLSPTDHIVIPFVIDNKMQGEIYGIEVSSDWKIYEWWRLHAAYTYLQIQLHLDEDSTDIMSESAEGESPHNQFSLRSSTDLGRDVELDLWLRYVDDLPAHVDEQDAAEGIADIEEDPSQNEDGRVDQKDQPPHAHPPSPV